MNIPTVNVDAPGSERTSDVTNRIVGHYRRIADGLPGNAIAAIQDMRDAAIAAFAEKGLPNRRVEDWKYTDLRRLMLDAYAPAEAQSEIAPADFNAALAGLDAIDAIRLVFVDGHLHHDFSDAGDLPAGVQLTNLAKALYAPAPWVLASLGKTNMPEGDVVSLLNTGFMTDGAVLHLAEGAKLTRPLHIVHVAVNELPFAATTRNLIVAEDGAEATIIESFLSICKSGAQINTVTEVKAGARTKIRHFKLAMEHADIQHLASACVQLGDGSDYLALNFADGNSVARHQTFLRFAGAGARGHFYGAQLLRDRQHCDMTLVVDHDAVGCESREHVKAVLADRAHGVFQAKVVVHPGAQQTDGRQMAQALLLSDDAEFDAKPELEIYADDVKCNHGATFGSLDDDQLFYLRARGIPEEEARSLLIEAFVGEVFDPIGHEGLQAWLAARVGSWLA